jgi:2-C-methyl-D-erythritol 4-phosphate cytidylyltransferase
MPAAHPPAGSDAAVPRLYALVPCAGVGERAGTTQPKQYTVLAGDAVVAHTLAALAQVKRLTAVLVVLSASDPLFESCCAGFAGWVARCGGATRALSVTRGLDELLQRGARRDDWVLVHDAARCLVRAEWIDRLIDACLDDAVGGLLALPLADTLKQELNGRSMLTIERGGKWAAQTPQMFRLGMLRDALVSAGSGVTDEASAIEAAGHSSKLIQGSIENIKLTWPEDFDFAARLLGNAPQRDASGAKPYSEKSQ